jgi:hypothetical protein
MPKNKKQVKKVQLQEEEDDNDNDNFDFEHINNKASGKRRRLIVEQEEEPAEEEEEEEEEDEVKAPRILRMQDYYKMLEITRAIFVDNKIKYEKELYTTSLNPEDNKFLKMYLMTVGSPTDSERPKRKKTLTAFVGASQTSTVRRVHEHNIMGAEHKNPRTKNGASMWKLCMILFVPQTLRDHLSSQIIHKYWDSAHGKGKINRGLFLHKFFGLPCYIPDDLREIILQQSEKFKMPLFKEYDFKPANVNSNESNKKLIFF